MECPICKTEGAYIGFLEILCINLTCIHFNEKYYFETKKVVQTDISEYDPANYSGGLTPSYTNTNNTNSNPPDSLFP